MFYDKNDQERTDPAPADLTLEEIVQFMARCDGHLNPYDPRYIVPLWDVWQTVQEHCRVKGDDELRDKIRQTLRKRLDEVHEWNDYDPAINLLYGMYFGGAYSNEEFYALAHQPIDWGAVCDRIEAAKAAKATPKP